MSFQSSFPSFWVTTSISIAVPAIYDIVSKIPASIKTVVGLGNRVMVPTASELMTLKERGRTTNYSL